MKYPWICSQTEIPSIIGLSDLPAPCLRKPVCCGCIMYAEVEVVDIVVVASVRNPIHGLSSSHQRNRNS